MDLSAGAYNQGGFTEFYSMSLKNYLKCLKASEVFKGRTCKLVGDIFSTMKIVLTFMIFLDLMLCAVDGKWKVFQVSSL